VNDVDPRLVAAMQRQLASRPPGAARVGWKYGSGDGERIGDEIAVGYLTSATVLADGGIYQGRAKDLYADAELAVEVGSGGSVARYSAALELVDLAGDEGPEEVVATNVWHRAVAFGRFSDVLPRGVEGALVVNGERRATGPAPSDVAERVAAVGRVLDAAGERLEAGDRVITGLIVNTPVAAGDEVVAELGPLGRVTVRIG
jgi:hypothetical protein